jgi:glycine dehydrogenase subunit 1
MNRIHHFLPNSPPNIEKKMLSELGLSSIEELYSDVPRSVILKRGLNIPTSLTEMEVERMVTEKLGKNLCGEEYLSFLGGGSWQGYVPAAVDEITSRAEFYTSYTQYQPEISQGMLQALFEYQSLICELTGMDVCNSSMYDWATALGEAGRMAKRVTQRNKILVSESASPERIEVLKTYCIPAGMEISKIPFDKSRGTTKASEVRELLDENVCAVYIENPNFFGVIEEEVYEIGTAVRNSGAIYIIGLDPTSLGILVPPAEYGADVVIGEGQPLGLYPNFGGPYLGIFATKKDNRLVRQMPGRIIGLTEESGGGKKRRSFSMVLQTREQHIRRESATSNICTNEALCALGVAAYLALVGPKGLTEICQKLMINSHYLANKLSEVPGLSRQFDGPFFREFVVNFTPTIDLEKVQSSLLKEKIIPGLLLRRFFHVDSMLKNSMLVSTLEIHEIGDLDRFVETIGRNVRTN